MPSRNATSDETQSLESAPAPQHDVPALTPDKPNRWCIDGQYYIYEDDKSLNEKMVMNRVVTLERRVLTRSHHKVPDVHSLFTFHRVKWMARSLGSYSEEIV